MVTSQKDTLSFQIRYQNDTMLALFEFLERESEPAARSVLGHFIFWGYSPLYGQQRKNGAFHDECNDGFRAIRGL
jgi:hypothetical protein